jgi:hypothetical protein
MCQQEASLASITCSLIIIRSEDAINHPTLPTSVGSHPTMVSTEPPATPKFSKSQNGKVFAFSSMEVNVGVASSVDEEA